METEALTLTVDNVASVEDLNNESESATAFIKNFNDCGIEGLVDGILATGACIEDGNAKTAEFAFAVKLAGSYNQQSQVYAYKFEGQKFNDNEYEILGIYVNGVRNDSLSPEGTFVVDENSFNPIEGITVQVRVEAKEKLDGTEALTLTVDNVASVEDLNNESESATAFIKNFNDCGIEGLVDGILATGACIEDGNAKTAEFAFAVKLAGSYNQQSQVYAYKFEGQKFNDNEYEILGIYVNGVRNDSLSPEGTFVVDENSFNPTEGITVQVRVEAKEKLDGTEALTLTVDNVASVEDLNNESESATAFIKNFNDCGIEGLVEGILATGACIEDGNAKTAEFAFAVKLAGSYNQQSQVYAYKFEGQKFNDNEYEILGIYVNGVRNDSLSPEGTFVVDENSFNPTEGITVQVRVEAKDKLDGTEALTLTVDNVASVEDLNNESESATAFIKNFNDCGIEGLVDGILATGACIEDGNAKTAEFAFAVKLAGSYNQQSQVYAYKFEGQKFNDNEYEILGIYVNGVRNDSLSPEGTFVVDENSFNPTEGITVQVRVEAKDKLDGTEALTLTVDNVASVEDLNNESESATAFIKNFNDCGIEGLVDGILATGACIEDGNAKTAEFAFAVKLAGSYNQQSQVYAYKFEGQKFNDNEYEILGIYVNGVRNDSLSPEGTFVVDENSFNPIEGITVQVRVEAEEKLDGTEALTLTVDNVASVDDLNKESESATAFIKNFNDCGIEGLVDGILATGACIEDGNAKTAEFAFAVKLAGSYNQQAQVYAYKFEGQKFNDNEYEILGIYVNGVRNDSLSPEGTFVVDENSFNPTEGITVQVRVKAEDKLDGTEALTRTVDNVASVDDLNNESESATAFIKNFNDCGIEGLVEGILATGACIEDGNAKTAEFAFAVKLAGSYNQQSQVYAYKFEGQKFNDNEYEILGIYVNGVRNDSLSPEGTFVVDENSFNPIEGITVQVRVKAEEKLDGTEALTLTVDNVASVDDLNKDSESATAFIKNFNDCGIEGLCGWNSRDGSVY